MHVPEPFGTRRVLVRRTISLRKAGGTANAALINLSSSLRAQDFLVLKGDEEEFSTFAAGLQADIEPVGAVELDLFAQHAHAAWDLRRCRRAEAAPDTLYPPTGDPLLDSEGDVRFKRIEAVTRRAERTYQRTFKAIQALQARRHGATKGAAKP